MEAIKSRGIAKDGKLIIPVPASFNEQELEVIVLSIGKQHAPDKSNRDEEKTRRLLSIVGTAKYPDLSNDILDVYEQ